LILFYAITRDIKGTKQFHKQRNPQKGTLGLSSTVDSKAG